MSMHTKDLEFVPLFTLSAKQLQEITTLQEMNFKATKQMAPLYIGILENKRLLPSVIVFNKKREIIAFATLFLFESDAVEASCFIHPKYISQHIIAKLFKNFSIWLEQNAIKKITVAKPFVLQHPILRKLELSYKKSEHHLLWKSYVSNPKIADVIIEDANMDMLDEMGNLHILCFPITLETILMRLNSTLQEAASVIIVAKRNSKIVGKLHIRFEKFVIQFTDIAVHPDFQRQGIATTLIMNALKRVNALEEPRKIMLNVEEDNPNAYALYLKLGFVKTTNCDYFTVSTENWLKTIPKE